MNNNNFSYLLVALLILLLGIPLAEELRVLSAPIVRMLLFSTMLAIGVWSLKGGASYFKLGMLLAAAGIVLNVATASIESQLLSFSSFIAIFGFLTVAVIYTFRQIALGTKITFNRLVGAICVYLLFGMIWAFTYTLVEAWFPGSFRGIESTMDRGWDSEWLYFSFVTMTTLGYGDISPVLPLARALAYLQAVFGQFYIAMLVAGLVGGYLARRHTAPDDN